MQRALLLSQWQHLIPPVEVVPRALHRFHELRLKDTDSAREREVQISTSDKAPLLNKIVTPVLALSILILTFVLFGVVMFDDTPVEASRKDILIYILGVLSAIASQIVSYYFGSSVGSKDKTDALKEAIK